MIATVALAAAAPALPLGIIARRDVASVTSLWLLGLVAAGSVWLTTVGELWLGLVGLWLLLHWRSSALLSTVLGWAGVAATWGLLRTLPASAFDVVLAGWLLVAGAHVALMAWGPSRRARRRKATLGSPAAQALLFGLLLPLAPLLAWPALLVGFWWTSSWVALLGVLGGALVRWPDLAWAWGAAILLGVLLWAVRPLREVVLEMTPRGNATDTFRWRWHVLLLTLLAMTEKRIWLRGDGPETMAPQLRRWASRFGTELPNAEAHCEPLQVVYEYGVLGALILAAFVWRVAPGLAWGDPWSAAWVAGAVLALGHWPMRLAPIGLVWLAVSARVAG